MKDINIVSATAMKDYCSYIITFILLIAFLLILKSDLDLKSSLIICVGILALRLVTEVMTIYIYPQLPNISEAESLRAGSCASQLES